jgi:Zn-dependent protease
LWGAKSGAANWMPSSWAASGATRSASLRAVLAQSTPDLVRTIALNLLVMVLSLSVHECAHAWVAYCLGDDTAEKQGRLSLSPASHVDPVGTLLIPTLNLVMSGSFGFIGWARPTPLTPSRFRKSVPPRGGEALVAIAGPFSNLLLAIASLALFALLRRGDVGLWDADGRATGVAALLIAMFQVNVGLTIFNILPIPPLDGSKLLPAACDRVLLAIAPYSIVVLLLLINIPVLRDNLVSRPVLLTMNLLQSLLRTQIVPGFAS